MELNAIRSPIDEGEEESLNINKYQEINELRYIRLLPVDTGGVGTVALVATVPAAAPATTVSWPFVWLLSQAL
jgi:hypothetical protein